MLSPPDKFRALPSHHQVLDAYLFEDRAEIREITEIWFGSQLGLNTVQLFQRIAHPPHRRP